MTLLHFFLCMDIFFFMHLVDLVVRAEKRHSPLDCRLSPSFGHPTCGFRANQKSTLGGRGSDPPSEGGSARQRPPAGRGEGPTAISPERVGTHSSLALSGKGLPTGLPAHPLPPTAHPAVRGVGRPQRPIRLSLCVDGCFSR